VRFPVFTLKIKTDNAAFEEWPKAEVVADLLEKVARDLREGPTQNVADRIRDRNGNTVGEYRLT
jgi:hypothetical protein